MRRFAGLNFSSFVKCKETVPHAQHVASLRGSGTLPLASYCAHVPHFRFSEIIVCGSEWLPESMI